MKKRKRILLIAVLVLILCGLGLVLFISHEPPEPVYQGKPLSYWLQGYDRRSFLLLSSSLRQPIRFQLPPGTTLSRPPQLLTSSSLPPPTQPPQTTQSEANRAVRAMGTNAIPRLLRMLQAHDSGLKLKAVALLQRQHWFQIPFEPADIKNHRALSAFNALGHSASNEVPRLIKIFESDSHPFPQQAVPAILGWIGPPAHDAIPALLRGMTSSDWMVRYNSTIAINEIHPEPILVVPSLIKLLDDPNALVCREAVRALGGFGSDAKGAVPALRKIAEKERAHAVKGTGGFGSFFEGPAVTGSWDPPTTTGIPTYAILALESIDPAAAAGIK